MPTKIKIKYTPPQNKIFFETKARVKLIHKGRRFGLTRGFANYVIDTCIPGGEKHYKKILWIDTINSNIDRYFDRYFMPLLKQIPQKHWSWNQTKKLLKIYDSYVDFRSADKPESIEGFGYDLIVVNEAGIVLKDENLWYNSIIPMTLDYKADMLIGGTPKGKRNKRLGKFHLFYELCEKAKDKPDWVVLHFTSYDNPLLNEEDIKELEEDVPSVVRRQEIGGEFTEDAASEIIKEIWWKTFSEFPDLQVLKIDSWDTANRTKEENDFSVKTSWILARTGMYMYDYFRDKLEYPALKKKVVEEYQKNKPDFILIEDKASGISLIDDLKETALPIKAIKKDKDKIAYASAASASFEAGKVHIFETHWTNKVKILCADFPSGEEDDTVDSVTQAVNFLKTQYAGNATNLITTKEPAGITLDYNPLGV